MESMEQEYIDKHDVAQRYLHGKLMPEEAEAFEVYLMENPELIEDLELDSILNFAIPKVDLSSASDVSNTSFLSAALSNHPLKLASGVLAFSIGLFTFLNLTPQKSPVVINPSIEYVSNIRGDVFDASESILTVTKTSGSLILVMQPEINSKAKFELVVNNSVGTEQIRIDNVRQNFQGDIVLALDLTKFEPGQYDVVLSPAFYTSELQPLKQTILLQRD